MPAYTFIPFSMALKTVAGNTFFSFFDCLFLDVRITTSLQPPVVAHSSNELSHLLQVPRLSLPRSCIIALHLLSEVAHQVPMLIPLRVDHPLQRRRDGITQQLHLARLDTRPLSRRAGRRRRDELRPILDVAEGSSSSSDGRSRPLTQRR